MELSAGGFIIDRNPIDRSQPPAAISAVRSVPREEASGGCTRCNSLTFSQDFYQAFGLLLCNQCRRSEKMVSKSAAKQQFGLTDADLKRLGSVRRPNPQRKDWHPMQLYLQSQVDAVSRQKHPGGSQQMEERQRELLDQKLQKRVRKREEEAKREAREKDKLVRIREQLDACAKADPSRAAVELDEEEIEFI